MKRAAVAVLLMALPALADKGIVSSPRGREVLAARGWFESDEVVVARCVAAGDGEHDVAVSRAVRGRLAEGDKVALAKLTVPILGKEERQVGEETVMLEKVERYVLFLKKDGAGWRLADVKLWDGWAVGDPKEFGLLPAGGARVMDTLEKCETWATVSALAGLDAKDAAARVPGLRVLFHVRWWGPPVPGADALAALKAMGDEDGRKALAEIVTKDAGGFPWSDWDTVALGISWKLDALRDAAAALPDPPGMTADCARFALGPAGARDAALDRLADAVRQPLPEAREAVKFLASLQDADADARFRKMFEVSAKESPAWADLVPSMAYWRLRGGLGGRDVKALVAVAADPDAPARHDTTQREAIEELERITGRTFRPVEGARGAWAEGESWATWWRKEGSGDARFR